jgi:hypothetical protein
MSSNRHNYQQKDDTSDRWRNLTLSTQSASSQQQQAQSVQGQHQSQPMQRQLPHSPSGQQQQQQQQQGKQKKKKCRGNRKLQRYRAKLRKQGLNNETIATLIKNYNNQPNQDKDEEQTIAPAMNVELLIPVPNQVESIHKKKLKIKNSFYFSLKIAENNRK